MSLTAPALRQTPLADRHRQLGARMVDFGGWEMPIHYGSQLDEHHAVRQDAGMFDVSHMCVIDIHGAQARQFLQAVLANDAGKLQTPGKALYSCMLDPQGGILDDLIVYYQTDSFYRLIVNAATAAKDLDWLAYQARRLNSAVELIARRSGDAAAPVQPLAIIAVQGPQARAKCWQALPNAQAVAGELKPFHSVCHHDPELGEIMMARTGYTGEDGHELILPADKVGTLWDRLLHAGVRPAGLGARDTLRLEAGMNLYGQDMDETSSPLDCGLGWTVAMDDSRDFVGKAALLKQGQRWHTAGLVLLERGGVLRPGQIVETPLGEGRITSGTFSPTMKQSIALARLPLGAKPDQEVKVRIRDKAVSARVVQPPFVRNGQIKV